MRSVLLLGAAGFIGKRLLKHLYMSDIDMNLLALVRSRAQYVRALYDMQLTSSPDQELTNPRLLPLEGDLRYTHLSLTEEQLPLALHASVLIHGGEPMNLQLTESEAITQVLEPTRQVIAFITEMKAQGTLRHVIHLGTPLSMQANHASHEEQLAMLPYERAKLRAEEELRQACVELDVPLSIVNLGVVISDAQTGVHEQLSSFGLFVNYVRNGGLRAMRRLGAAWLPLVSMDTVAAFIGALVREAHPRSDAYPLLNPMGEQRTAVQLAERIARELRVPAAQGWLPCPKRRQEKAAVLRLLLTGNIDASATLLIQQRYSLASGLHDEDHLTFIIADIDYRLSHLTERTIPIPIISSEHTFSRPHHLPSPELPIELHYPHLNRYHSGYEHSELLIRRGQRGRLASWEIDGDESKPLLILLHGALSSSDLMLPMASHLKDMSIWLLDLPGYGRSPLFPFDNYVDYVIEEVAAAIQESNRKVIIGGHSFSGWIALKQLEIIPDLIEHLLLLQPVMQPPKHKFRSELLLRYMLRWLRPIDYMNILISMDCYEQYHHIPHDIIRMIVKGQRSSRSRYANALPISLFSYHKTFFHTINLSDHAEQISVLWGFHDEIFKLPAEILPHHVTRVPNGHYMPISHPVETAAWIRSRIYIHMKQTDNLEDIALYH